MPTTRLINRSEQMAYRVELLHSPIPFSSTERIVGEELVRVR